MPHNPAFCGVVICSFHTIGCGMVRIRRSVTTSDTTNPNSMAFVLSQYFSIVSALVQKYLSSVLHWKANANKKDRDHSTVTAHMASEQWLNTLPTKSLRYNISTLNFITPSVRASIKYETISSYTCQHVTIVRYSLSRCACSP